MEGKEVSRRPYSDAELLSIVHNNPEKMRNIWRERVRKGVDFVKTITDPIERERREKQLYLQKKKLREWELKAKRNY